MIDRDHELSVSRQAQLLPLPRSTVYYLPNPTSLNDLAPLRRTDELCLEHPIAGAWMRRKLLRHEGQWVGRKDVGTWMTRMMGVEELNRRPNTFGRHSEHRIASTPS
jgi:putative transposase